MILFFFFKRFIYLLFFKYVTNFGSKAVFRTNKNAPNYKLITIDLSDWDQSKWGELLSEHPNNVLDWAVAVDRNKFVACYIEDVKVLERKIKQQMTRRKTF